MKLNELRNYKDQQRTANNALLLAIGGKERNGKQERDQTEIFDIEPEIVVRFICPVEMKLQEAAGLLEREKDQLRQSKQQHDAKIFGKADPLCFSFLSHQGANQIKPADDTKRKEGMCMNQRQRTCEDTQREKCACFTLNRRAVQQEQARKQQRPAKEQRALRDHHVRNRIDPAKPV
ncbi:hypothetical protein SDC9_153157 [bioreactor metagenome]|uniref:Uncharacterized protein n=1 Tax=bioreactor metagenome TaxID=1076179 RepID=A0A645EZS0_9ZZZZ